MSRKSSIFGGRTRYVVVALATLGLAAAITGCRHHGSRFMTPERIQKMVTWRVNDMLDDLGANDGQRKEIHAIKDRLLTEAKALHEAGAPSKAAMLAAWNQDAPDAEKMRSIVDERIEALRAAAYEAVDASIEAHAVLTPEQRAQLVEEIEKHQKR